MRNSLLDLLACPICSAFPLGLSSFEENESAAEDSVAETITGLLHCNGCSRWFPVRGGIPSLMPDELRLPAELEFFEHWSARLPLEVRERAGSFNAGLRDGGETGAKNRGAQEVELRDAEAEIYDSLYPDRKFQVELENFAELLKPRVGERVLDLGCGTGRATKLYLESGAEIVGTDYSFESLAFLRDQLTEVQRRPLELVQSDICYLPFRPRLFEAIVSSCVISFLPGEAAREQALSAAINVLKQKGILLISAYNFGLVKRLRGWLGVAHTGSKEGRSRGGGYYYNHSMSEFVDWLETDFEIDVIRGIDNRVPILHHLSAELNVRIDRLVSKTPLALPVFSRELLVRAIKR